MIFQLHINVYNVHDVMTLCTTTSRLYLRFKDVRPCSFHHLNSPLTNSTQANVINYFTISSHRTHKKTSGQLTWTVTKYMYIIRKLEVWNWSNQTPMYIHVFTIHVQLCTVHGNLHNVQWNFLNYETHSTAIIIYRMGHTHTHTMALIGFAITFMW